MTKQEEIKEGMEAIVSDMVYGVRAHFTSKEIVARLQKFESSQGVVIKVERELSIPEGHSIPAVLLLAFKDAGCAAVEPLIKEEV